ncbi:MAG: ComEA family DNA-binding protein [Candidatus Omnitrophica bacterium]|nr:ComEA family DNA-binding protein [Candidatus Omnitrophota bacterium]
MFYLTYRERVVLLFVLSLILFSCLINHYYQPKTLVMKSEDTFNSNSISLNLNTATKDELELLPGIGEVTASRIIEYRNLNGRFKSLEDFGKVKGIGSEKMKNLENKISF